MCAFKQWGIHSCNKTRPEVMSVTLIIRFELQLDSYAWSALHNSSRRFRWMAAGHFPSGGRSAAGVVITGSAKGFLASFSCRKLLCTAATCLKSLDRCSVRASRAGGRNASTEPSPSGPHAALEDLCRHRKTACVRVNSLGRQPKICSIEGLRALSYCVNAGRLRSSCSVPERAPKLVSHTDRGSSKVEYLR